MIPALFWLSMACCALAEKPDASAPAPRAEVVQKIAGRVAGKDLQLNFYIFVQTDENLYLVYDHPDKNNLAMRDKVSFYAVADGIRQQDGERIWRYVCETSAPERDRDAAIVRAGLRLNKTLKLPEPESPSPSQ